MKRNWMVLLSCSAICLAVLGVTLHSQAKSDDKAEIKALEDRLVKAVNARDIDAVMAVYVPDESLFVFDVIPPRQYVGAKAYRDDWKGFLDGPVSYESSELAVETDGDLAFGHKIFHAAGTDASGNKYDFTARVTDVYRKIKGKWLIVQEHVSVPVDVATGKADLGSKP